MHVCLINQVSGSEILRFLCSLYCFGTILRNKYYLLQIYQIISYCFLIPVNPTKQPTEWEVPRFRTLTELKSM